MFDNEEWVRSTARLVVEVPGDWPVGLFEMMSTVCNGLHCARLS
jgi:hypothetical protein